MLRYNFQCEACQETYYDWRKMADRNEPSFCPHCLGEGKRLIGAPLLKADISSDKWVKNREGVIKREEKCMRDHGTYK